MEYAPYDGYAIEGDNDEYGHDGGNRGAADLGGYHENNYAGGGRSQHAQHAGYNYDYAYDYDYGNEQDRIDQQAYETMRQTGWGGSTRLGKVGIFMDYLLSSQFSILVALGVIVVGQLLYKWREGSLNTTMGTMYNMILDMTFRVYDVVLAFASAVQGILHNLFGSNENIHHHMGWNYYDDEETEAMDAASDDDDTDLTESESTPNLARVGDGGGRSRRRRRRGRGGAARLLMRRQSSDAVPPPLLTPEENDDVDADYDHDMNIPLVDAPMAACASSDSKMENGNRNGMNGLLTAEGKAKQVFNQSNELEPAFLRDSDYPPGWLVYHPVLGVVSKEEADLYDKKSSQCRSIQNGQSQVFVSVPSIAAGG